MISVEDILHNFGFLGEVVVWGAKPLSCVDLVGNCHFGPGDPQRMSEPDVFSTFSGGSDGSARSGVPL